MSCGISSPADGGLPSLYVPLIPLRTCGAWLRFSIPPATTTSASPSMIIWVALMIDWAPLPQSRFSVSIGTSWGIPALSPACLAPKIACPEVCSAWPITTCSTVFGSVPDLSIAPLIAMVPSSSADTDANLPPGPPSPLFPPSHSQNGVLAPSTTTALSAMPLLPLTIKTHQNRLSSNPSSLGARRRTSWLRHGLVAGSGPGCLRSC